MTLDVGSISNAYAITKNDLIKKLLMKLPCSLKGPFLSVLAPNNLLKYVRMHV